MITQSTHTSTPNPTLLVIWPTDGPNRLVIVKKCGFTLKTFWFLGGSLVLKEVLPYLENPGKLTKKLLETIQNFEQLSKPDTTLIPEQPCSLRGATYCGRDRRWLVLADFVPFCFGPFRLGPGLMFGTGPLCRFGLCSTSAQLLPISCIETCFLC